MAGVNFVIKPTITKFVGSESSALNFRIER